MKLWPGDSEADREANIRGTRMIKSEVEVAIKKRLLKESDLSNPKKLVYYDAVDTEKGCTVTLGGKDYKNIFSIRLEPPCGKIMLYSKEQKKIFEALPKELSTIKISE